MQTKNNRPGCPIIPFANDANPLGTLHTYFRQFNAAQKNASNFWEGEQKKKEQYIFFFLI